MRPATTTALFDLLGADFQSPSFLSTVAQLGLGSETDWDIPEDEATGYLERPDLGLALAITERSSVEKFDGPELPLGLNGWVFSNIFVYLNGEDEYRPYTGELPYGLTSLCKRQSLVGRFGEPEWSRRDDGTLKAERWDLDGKKQLHVTYRADSEIALLSFGLRRNEPGSLTA